MLISFHIIGDEHEQNVAGRIIPQCLKAERIQQRFRDIFPVTAAHRHDKDRLTVFLICKHMKIRSGNIRERKILLS